MKKILLSLAIILGLTGIVYASSIPVNPPLFETYLSSPMGVSDTALTIASNKLINGTSLSGYVCVTIDTNTSTVEYACGTGSGYSIYGLTRGLGSIDGISTSTALIYAHRRGADVKITDYPVLTRLARMLSGLDGIPANIYYNATTTLTDGRNLVNKDYVDNIAFSGAGVVNANTGARGIVQIATPTQVASSTGTGSTGALLVIPSSVSTSTYSAGLPAGTIPTTGVSGKVDSNFISGVNPTGSITAFATSVAPSGWLNCDGTAYATTTYPILYSVIGYTYGSTSAGVNFKVPDLRGRTIVMASSTQSATSSFDRATIGAVGGETKHTQTLEELAAHSHTFTYGNNTPSQSYVAQDIYNKSGNLVVTPYGTDVTGSSIPSNVLDPYLVLSYIIKF